MKIGIIGLGRAGAAHVQAYRAHGIAIGAVAGSTYERTAKRADELGLSVVVCPSVEALLSRDDITLVSICSPPEWHHEHVMASAQAGKHMIVEKPVALSRLELERTTQAVREAGVHTGLASPLREFS
jgi:predicted dehydrogenase